MSVTFCLDNQASSKKPQLGGLLRALRELADQPVYRTSVYDLNGKKMAELCTTNEKVHLSFGKLSPPALRWLVELFEAETSLDAQLLFTFTTKEGQVNPRSLFVTSSEDGNEERVFHVAPGH